MNKLQYNIKFKNHKSQQTSNVKFSHFPTNNTIILQHSSPFKTYSLHRITDLLYQIFIVQLMLS